jgi:hypothetical protein
MTKNIAAAVGVVLLTSTMAFAGESGLSNSANSGTAPFAPRVFAAESNQAVARARAKRHIKRHRRHHHKRHVVRTAPRR